MKYVEDDHEFQRDWKKLVKRYKSLPEDFEILKPSTIELFHIHKINNNSIFEIEGSFREPYRFFKIKKFACKSLKGKGANSGLRVIYTLNVETEEITFIEIYHKSDQVNETKSRIHGFV